jgi:Ser/Thr protein kinase RdoA (MazF antagonist)
VQSRKIRNEFERSFWEQYTHYIAQAKEAVGMLQERKDQGGTRGFCHGDCNQHNMLRTAQGVRLVNYENLFYGEQMVDLANYLRKILEKNSWSTDMGKHILEAYEKQRKLCKEEKQLLHVLLLFPEKFWKVSNHYSNSHKAWVSGRDIEKLNRLIAAEPAREHFLENLFSFL